MIPHDILTLYSAKAIEYLIALAFLVLFVPFWRYTMGDVRRAVQPARALARQRSERRPIEVVEWFRVARDAFYHPGHAWARIDGSPGIVAIGLDDFAQKLVGRPRALHLPRIGETVRQGDKAWSIRVDGRAVDMLSPVDGVVTELNTRVLESPATIGRDPYVTGWLFKVRTDRFDANRKSLLSGRLVERWLEEETNALRRRLTPGLGLVLQDGGLPVDGLAQAVDAERWDQVAREFLLS